MALEQFHEVAVLCHDDYTCSPGCLVDISISGIPQAEIPYRDSGKPIGGRDPVGDRW